MPTNQPVCLGCCVSPNWNWFNPYYYHSIPTPEIKVNVYNDFGLAENEKEVLKNLALAWNQFTKLENRSEHDNKEFMDAIHRAQQLIALRVARRIDSDVWMQPE